jgi:hypothetical protein
MKKILFNLQLFAEGDPANNTDPKGTDPNTDPTGEPQGEPGADPKPDDKADGKKYTDDDVNRIVKQKKLEWQKQQEKAVDEAKKLAEMNATQKAEYERDKVQKELDEYKRKDALAEMSKTARKMLSDEGINIPDDLLSRLVTTDAEETKTAIDGFTKLFKSAVEDAVKEKARGTTPRNITNNAGDVSEIDKRIKKYE